MTWSRTIGLLLILTGLIGYVVGLRVAYPGRALSLTAVMAGVSLAAIAQQQRTVVDR